MIITIIPEDRLVIVGGVARKFDFDIDQNIHAVQWDTEKVRRGVKGLGKIEFYKGGAEGITDISPFQDILDKHAEIIKKEMDDREKAEKERAEYLETYEGKMETVQNQRSAEYPPIGDQLDEILKWITSERFQGENLPEGLDKIIGQWTSVKKRYPKPEEV